MLRRAQIVNLVEHSYYSNIDFRRLGTVLDCFAHDAVLSVDGRPTAAGTARSSSTSRRCWWTIPRSDTSC